MTWQGLRDDTPEAFFTTCQEYSIQNTYKTHNDMPAPIATETDFG